MWAALREILYKMVGSTNILGCIFFVSLIVRGYGRVIHGKCFNTNFPSINDTFAGDFLAVYGDHTQKRQLRSTISRLEAEDDVEIKQRV